MQIIGGKYKRFPLLAPRGLRTRPTSGQLRETVFNICQNKIEGAHFLDLFAGTGAMGLEALSRGAAHATFVENNKEVVHKLKQNITFLKEEIHTTVYSVDVFMALKKLSNQGAQFDIVYVDPPYEKDLGEQTLRFFDTHPLLKEGGILFVEDVFSEIRYDFQTIKLKSERRSGRATLKEYCSARG